jgi:hypothetical protein
MPTKEIQEKAKKEYRRTKDILHVMKMLGHKNVRSTFAFLEKEKCL